MTKKYQNIGALELEVLKVLWDRGQGSVMQVAEGLAKDKGYARTTILTVMQRLLDALSQPYRDRPQHAGYRLPPPPSALPYRTFCGT